MKTDPISCNFNMKTASGYQPNIQQKNCDSPFSIRFSQKQRETLKRDAKGKPLGIYIRSLIFEDDGVLRKRRNRSVKDVEAMGKALALLGQSRLSSNVNQIAKAANSGALPVTPEMCHELTEACEEIRQMRSLLVKALGVRKQGS